MTTARHHLYWIHGLIVESDIALDSVALDPDRAPQSRDVSRRGSRQLRYRITLKQSRECPDSPPAGRVVFELDDLPGFWVAEDPGGGERWTIRFAGFADFYVDRPSGIIAVYPTPALELGMISIFLAGTVLAFVLAAEGRLTLHASAIVLEGRALAIAGPSGWGKSTIAAIMCGAGADLLTDDALRVDVVESEVTCYPGTRTIRLRQSAGAVSDNVTGAAVGQTADGRAGLVPPRMARRDAPLAAVLLPCPVHGARDVLVDRLGGTESVRELLPQARFGWSFLTDGGARLFELTAELASAVPVYRAVIPWGPPFAPRLAEQLFDELRLRQTRPDGYLRDLA